jgi:isochorismate hydrolase
LTAWPYSRRVDPNAAKLMAVKVSPLRRAQSSPAHTGERASGEQAAFFDTGLAAWLTMNRVDTLLVTGCTTSSCVRASVVDAIAHNYRPIVVSDCVGDRAIEPHKANLFDMEQKYADVVPSVAVLDYLETSQLRRAKT